MDKYKKVIDNAPPIEFETPFEAFWDGLEGAKSSCWVIKCSLFGKYYVKGYKVTAIAYRASWGYILGGKYWMDGNLLGKDLFEYKDLEKALEECVRRNKLNKVKVKMNGI